MNNKKKNHSCSSAELTGRPRLTSLQNPRVKQAVRLRDRRDRDREQLFIIEGYREILRASENGYPIETTFFCPAMFQGGNENMLLRRLDRQGVLLFEVSPMVLGKMAYRDRPEGLVAVARQRHCLLSEFAYAGSTPLLLAAEAIEKPDNLGTMLRSADATGVDGLFLCDPCTDLFNPNVVRASTGTLFSVPVVETTAAAAQQWFAEKGIVIAAGDPDADRLYTEVDLTGPVAIVVGTEQYGLSDRWLRQAACQVRIPMLGKADSLNVASAATLLLYEAVRQRGRRG